MRYRLLGLVLFVAALLGVKFAFAQSQTFQPAPYTYRIDSAGCKFDPMKRRQTGFRVKGLKGIVTALHGVADCTDQLIKAYGGNGTKSDATFETLQIVAVDIDRDIALLSSKQLEALPADGWEAPPTVKLPSGRLAFYGYPYAITYQQPTTQITVTTFMTLSEMIAGQFVPPAFATRNSPNPTFRVFYAEAHLAPGYSGAPVIQANKQVIGMVDGGFEEKGEAGKGWLIPWGDIKLQPLYGANDQVNPKLQAAWTKLIDNDPELSLGFLSTFPVQPATTANQVKYTGLVTDKQAQLPITGARVLLIFAQTGEQLVDYTDSDGIYSFQFPINVERTEARLYLRADGYGAADYHVTLQPSPSQVDFRLVALPPTSTPTSTPLPTATATATVTPPPTPTPGYPCEATVIPQLIGEKTINFLYLSKDGNIRKNQSISVGAKVKVLEGYHNEKPDETYYHIKMGSIDFGWIPKQYLELSFSCPQISK